MYNCCYLVLRLPGDIPTSQQSLQVQQQKHTRWNEENFCRVHRGVEGIRIVWYLPPLQTAIPRELPDQVQVYLRTDGHPRAACALLRLLPDPDRQKYFSLYDSLNNKVSKILDASSKPIPELHQDGRGIRLQPQILSILPEAELWWRTR